MQLREVYRVYTYDVKLNDIFKTNEMCQRISKIEGIGPITATAIVATIGDPNIFKNGRHFAAFLGLVPKQSSSGSKERLLGISKRGNIYVRLLLIHGGRAVKVAVAVANKNARIIWALLAKNEQYRKAA